MDALTIPRYEALLKYWRRFPPLHIMVAGYLGLGKYESAPTRSGGDFAEFFTAVTGQPPPDLIRPLAAP